MRKIGERGEGEREIERESVCVGGGGGGGEAYWSVVTYFQDKKV